MVLEERERAFASVALAFGGYLSFGDGQTFGDRQDATADLATLTRWVNNPIAEETQGLAHARRITILDVAEESGVSDGLEGHQRPPSRCAFDLRAKKAFGFARNSNNAPLSSCAAYARVCNLS